MADMLLHLLNKKNDFVFEVVELLMLQILLLLSLVDNTITVVIEIPKFALMTGLSKKCTLPFLYCFGESNTLLS